MLAPPKVTKTGLYTVESECEAIDVLIFPAPPEVFVNMYSSPATVVVNFDATIGAPGAIAGAAAGVGSVALGGLDSLGARACSTGTCVLFGLSMPDGPDGPGDPPPAQAASNKLLMIGKHLIKMISPGEIDLVSVIGLDIGQIGKSLRWRHG